MSGPGSSASDDDVFGAVLDAANNGEFFDDDGYYGSISDLLAQLGRNDDPATLFDTERELPEWLRDAVEHQVCAVDSATTARAHPDISFNTGHGKAYWVKVSSAAGLIGELAGSSDYFKDELRRGVPVYVFVMPTTPLDDASRIYDMTQGIEELPVEGMAVHIWNHGGFESKLCAYKAAKKLLEDIRNASAAVESNRICLAVAAEAKLKHLHDMKAEYDKAKISYLAARRETHTETITELAEEMCKMSMRMACSRLLVAREVAKGMQDSVTTMGSLGDSLARKAADLSVAMSRLTFMGCPSPAPFGFGGGVRPFDGN